VEAREPHRSLHLHRYLVDVTLDATSHERGEMILGLSLNSHFETLSLCFADRTSERRLCAVCRLLSSEEMLRSVHDSVKISKVLTLQRAAFNC